MVFTYWDMVLGNLLMFAVGAGFSLFGVFIGGFFVLRAKGNGYEPIIPPLRDRDTGAMNLDDFAAQPEEVEVNFDDAIEKIFKQRTAEEVNTPADAANDRMKGQM